MNNIIKKISCLFLIVILGYTQIGCQSQKLETNTQVVKDFNSQEISKEESNVENSEIHFIDTGNSDSILIIQNGKAALIDGGDNDDEELVVSYLKNQGVKELEYIFATHPHADHIGGLDAVINEIKVNNLYVSNGDSDTKTYRDFIQAASNKGLYPSVPLLGSKFKLESSTFEVLSVANGNDPNNNSIVLLYTNGNDKVLLMGDAEEEVERNINPGKIDLLKVGHHGSHSSSSEEFINKINPQYGVILVGKNNKYGHPHVETMDLLKDKNIEVHRSDECGHIIFTSTGNGLEVNCSPASYNSGSDLVENTEKEESKLSLENNNQDKNESQNISSKVVYWTSSGKKYHSNQNCSNMKNPVSGTIEESGRTPCNKCY